jgi:hypothetical protein
VLDRKEQLWAQIAPIQESKLEGLGEKCTGHGARRINQDHGGNGPDLYIYEVFTEELPFPE